MKKRSEKETYHEREETLARANLELSNRIAESGVTERTLGASEMHYRRLFETGHQALPGGFGGRSSADLSSSMSVLVPNHLITCPAPSRRGTARVLNQR